jgi:Spy/CpxP family protein refolding chaperone
MCCHPKSGHTSHSDCCPPDDCHHSHHSEHHHCQGEDPGGGLGVRRPLRFLAWKLGLSEDQVTGLAAVLSELKTERAQAAVDDRRALALLADAVQGESYDRKKAAEAAQLRVQSTERLQQTVVESLGRIHAALEPEQRARLAYLLRTGTLMM